MPESNFIDYVKIFCTAGHGGAGSMHLYRAKYIPKGGPDGGDGGHGGSIILKANPQFWTLIHLKFNKFIKADDGQKGGGALCTGKSGTDVILDVPVGTVAKNAETGEVLFELLEAGEQRVLCKGGRGGLGNDNFKSPTLQTPRFAQPGEPGEEGAFILELKLLADVGLVGFPNAGKSTLLSTVTAAKPKIASYAFTTLEPNLGIVPYRDGKSFVMADIPGIIEGASEGKGIGLRFLRHIERNSLLLFLISCESDNIRKDYEVLTNELKKFNPEMLDKKRILAVTKCDLIDEELMEMLRADLPTDVPCVFISSASEFGLAALKDLIWEELNSESNKLNEIAGSEKLVHRNMEVKKIESDFSDWTDDVEILDDDAEGGDDVIEIN